MISISLTQVVVLLILRWLPRCVVLRSVSASAVCGLLSDLTISTARLYRIKLSATVSAGFSSARASPSFVSNCVQSYTFTSSSFPTSSSSSSSPSSLSSSPPELRSFLTLLHDLCCACFSTESPPNSESCCRWRGGGVLYRSEVGDFCSIGTPFSLSFSLSLLLSLSLSLSL